MSLLNSFDIERIVSKNNLLRPFVGFGQSQKGKVSNGLSQVGYDLTCSNIFKYVVNTDITVDILNLKPVEYKTVEAPYFDIEPGDTILTCSVEYIKMPTNLFALCFSKSTYARVGINVNTTPIQPGCEGIITIEVSNISRNKVRIHANQGIAQLIFFKLKKPARSYKDSGKYNKQIGVNIGRIE